MTRNHSLDEIKMNTGQESVIRFLLVRSMVCFVQIVKTSQTKGIRNIRYFYMQMPQYVFCFLKIGFGITRKLSPYFSLRDNLHEMPKAILWVKY